MSRMRSDCMVSWDTNVRSGLPKMSAAKLLSTSPVPNACPSFFNFDRLYNVETYSAFKQTWVKICSLLMSAHTSPQSHQTRPVFGKSSHSVQRRNASISTTQKGTLILPPIAVTTMCRYLGSRADVVYDKC